jgi:hypothetical protein
MNTARLSMNCAPEIAMRRVREWVDAPLPFLSVTEHPNSWVTLDLGGYSLEYLDTEDWLRLGKHVDLFFESYSTSLCAGEILVILAGEVRRHIVIDSVHPEHQLNIGRMRYEERSPLLSWTDIWTFVEDHHWQNEID